jgi:hypothetical protein
MPAPLRIRGRKALEREVRALRVDVEHFVEGVLSRVLHRPGVADSRTDEQGVHASERLPNRRGELVDLRDPRCVALHSDHVIAELAASFSHVCCGAAGDEDASAFLSEEPCGRETHTAGPTDDRELLVFVSLHRACSFQCTSSSVAMAGGYGASCISAK